MKYVLLTEEAFSQEYQKAFEKLPLQTEAEQEAFREQLFSVQGAVENALQQKWEQAEDFEVGWNYDFCYHTCGGIYSEAIFCPEYVETVVAALRTIDPDGIWTYHTVCEITIGESMEDCGEFFVRGDTCFIKGAMSPEWRKRLGCNE